MSASGTSGCSTICHICRFYVAFIVQQIGVIYTLSGDSTFLVCSSKTHTAFRTSRYYHHLAYGEFIVDRGLTYSAYTNIKYLPFGILRYLLSVVSAYNRHLRDANSIALTTTLAAHAGGVVHA